MEKNQVWQLVNVTSRRKSNLETNWLYKYKAQPVVKEYTHKEGVVWGNIFTSVEICLIFLILAITTTIRDLEL